MESTFHILEHPADVGIEATGQSLKEAFENAARGLVSIIAVRSSIDPVEERYIKLTSHDVEHLLIKWLSEILYLFDGEDFLTADVQIERITPGGLEACILGESFDELKHELKLDVKAVTYHQLAIEERTDGVRVRVYLDI